MPRDNAIVDVNAGSLDLNQLTEFQFAPGTIAAAHAKTEREKAEFKAKYGADWKKKWMWHVCHPHDYDANLKFFNTVIYHNGVLNVCGTGDVVRRDMAAFEKRCREVYGDEYDALKWHEYADSRVVELLLQDALRTGKWKELPDELQEEYHRRVSK